jgi:hypothetical protein
MPSFETGEFYFHQRLNRDLLAATEMKATGDVQTARYTYMNIFVTIFSVN